MTKPQDHNPEGRPVLDSKDFTPEEFKVLCDVFATLLRWDEEEKAKSKSESEAKAS